MLPNVRCESCSAPIYRSASQLKQSKSGLYFCSHNCKTLWLYEEKHYEISLEHKISVAMTNVYSINRYPEYLTRILLVKWNSKELAHRLGDYFVLVSAGVSGIPNLSKSPNDCNFIRSCFDQVSLVDIESLKNVPSNWKSIRLRYCNPQSIYLIDDIND